MAGEAGAQGFEVVPVEGLHGLGHVVGPLGGREVGLAGAVTQREERARPRHGRDLEGEIASDLHVLRIGEHQQLALAVPVPEAHRVVARRGELGREIVLERLLGRAHQGVAGAKAPRPVLEIRGPVVR